MYEINSINLLLIIKMYLFRDKNVVNPTKLDTDLLLMQVWKNRAKGVKEQPTDGSKHQGM